jgi:hypothetical protein
MAAGQSRLSSGHRTPSYLRSAAKSSSDLEMSASSSPATTSRSNLYLVLEICC